MTKDEFKSDVSKEEQDGRSEPATYFQCDRLQGGVHNSRTGCDATFLTMPTPHTEGLG
jgi:hypothetical protein